MKRLIAFVVVAAIAIFIGQSYYAQAASRFCMPVAQAHIETMKKSPPNTVYKDLSGDEVKTVVAWAIEQGFISKHLIVNGIRLYASPTYHKVALGFINDDCAVWMTVFPKKMWEDFFFSGEDA